MAKRKRASMREGPLADLFRSTGEAEVAVAEEEIRVERIETHEPAPAEPAAGEQVMVEEEITIERTGSEPLAEEATVDPAEDRRVEDVPPDRRTAEVAEESEIEHEGLERLMGASENREIESAYGREAPAAERRPLIPRTHEAVLRVFGVGGAGVNAVNRMVDAGLPGVEFVAINTDLQSLQNSRADTTLHIGAELTRGLGAGSDPRVGYRSAFEEQDKIKTLLKGSDMVFLACGAGGGTGTGAAPVVAKLARDVGALTVAAVTKPFAFEGARRAAQAEQGIAALGAEVDTTIVIPNERLLSILERRTTMTDAFRVADDVLRQAVQGISDLVMLPGLINLDFADVRTTMLEAGDAILGIGMGVGEHRALLAAEKAVSSPLLDSSVEGAHSLLLSVTGGPDLSLVEASEAARIVQQAAHPDANIIFGASIDEDMKEEVWITVIATRFDSPYARRPSRDERGDGPREPRIDRDGDPLADWRTDGDRRSRGARNAALNDGGGRLASVDEVYGGEGRRRGRHRRSAMPASTSSGLLLDVPEFLPGQ